VIIQIVVITKAAFLNYYLRLDAITRVMYEVCEDAVHDGVKYLEVRFSPILHVNGNIIHNKYAVAYSFEYHLGGLSLSGVMEAIIQGLVRIRKSSEFELQLPIY
jgi:hypothetical protein